MDANSREILAKVERGELTPAEGAALMAGSAQQLPEDGQPLETAQVENPALPEGPAPAQDPNPAPGAESEPGPAPQAEVVEDFQSLVGRWKQWWVVPLCAGAVIFILGAIWIAWGNYSQRLFWFYCGVFPLLLGLGVMLLAFWSRQSRWLHVRIKSDKNGRHERIAISMPLPTHLVGWILKTFGRKIPGLREQPEVIDSMPDIMAALDQTGGEPLIVEVNDKNCDEVKVYIM
jgi:hypothetical protein